MRPLFDRNYAYPHDETGAYVELEGKVIDLDRETGRVEVQTKNRGAFTAYDDWLRGNTSAIAARICKQGATVRIRVYDSGGGFYPDNKIMGWTSATKEEANDG